MIRVKSLKRTEKVVLREVKEYLEITGWLVMRNHQSLGSQIGRSDLEALKDGVTIYIECKGEKGKLSRAQEAFQRKIEEKGGIYIVARSFEDVIEGLKKGDL
jgi:hypothetical protein